MIKCVENSDDKEAATKQLLNNGEVGQKNGNAVDSNDGHHRKVSESVGIYMDDDDDEEEKEAAANSLLNGNTIMSLSSITPRTHTANAYLFRNRFSTRLSSRRGVRKRVVFKNGDCNVSQENVAKRRRRYMADIFTTLVDIQWRYNLMVFSMGFLLSWLSFAIIWWLICFTHGDLEHLDDQQWTPCVQSLKSFTSAFLFSIETQHTIGYGYRYITEECPEAIFILCVQSVAGVMIQAFMVGVVFAKLSRPKKRTQTLLFSRNAVVTVRDGKLCLMFRIADMRKSHIIEAQVHAQVIKKRVTLEGEILSHHLHDVKLGFDSCDDHLFFIWPCTLVHVIDDTSPFYNMSARDLLRENFEVVVILEGCIESTGMTTQARSSYLPSEILWGYRFDQLVTYRKETGEYEVDYSRFNNTYEVETPLCSASELVELQKTGGHLRKRTSTGPRYKKGSSRYPMIRSHSLEALKKTSLSEADVSKHKDAGLKPAQEEDSGIV